MDHFVSFLTTVELDAQASAVPTGCWSWATNHFSGKCKFFMHDFCLKHLHHTAYGAEKVFERGIRIRPRYDCASFCTRLVNWPNANSL
jgi:hypothetical protein